MAEDMVFKSSEASSGGFQGIKKIRGIQVSIERVPGKAFEEGKTAKDQAQIKLEDVVILEMEEGEDEPGLKEGKFTIWMGYANPGKKAPNKNSLWIKGFVASAEALGKTPPDFNGQYVTLARKMVHLFTDDNGKDVSYAGWVYEKDEAESGAGIKEHIKSLVIGATQSAVTRSLLLDPRAKQYPEYRKAMNDGTIETLLGVVLGEDGKYKDNV